MGASNQWDGTITFDDFKIAAQSLAKRWDSINPTLPPWTWVSCSRLPCGASHKEEGYLTLQNVYRFPVNQDILVVSGEAGPIDEATLVQGHDYKVHLYDFHIIYRSSYQVPVLYFYGSSLDGQPLGFDNFEQDLPQNSWEALREAKWTFITQEEHPYLNRPWFMLHPCGTSAWMKLLLDECLSKNELRVQQYLVSWLSVVGQAVGLRVSAEMLGKPETSIKDVSLTDAGGNETFLSMTQLHPRKPLF